LLVGGQQCVMARLAKEQLERVERARIGLCLRLQTTVTVRVGTIVPTALAAVPLRADALFVDLGLGVLAAGAVLLLKRIQLDSIVRMFDDDRIIRPIDAWFKSVGAHA